MFFENLTFRKFSTIATVSYLVYCGIQKVLLVHDASYIARFLSLLNLLNFCVFSTVKQIYSILIS